MMSRRPYWCPKTMKRRPRWCPKTMKRWPCWCPKPVLWELNSFLVQTLSFVPINLHRCWPCEWKRSRGFLQLCAKDPGLWIEARMVVTLFCYKPTCILYMCKSWYSHANKPANMIIHIWKTRRFVTKQGYCQPLFYSKARALSTQL